MNTPANGPKNAPQPRPASPAPITPPSRKASPVVQSLQVLALYAALVAVVCLLVTCSPATAQTIAPRHTAGYAGPARESDGPDFGESEEERRTAARIHCGFFVRDFRPCPRYGKAGWDTREGVPDSFLSGSPTRSVLPPYLAKVAGLQSIKKGAAHHG